MLTSKTVSSATGYKTAFVLTLSLFALWGMGQQLYGVLLPKIAGPLHLQGFEEEVAKNASSVVYMLCAIPAAIYATRLGYKAAILCGLGCVTFGYVMLYPAVVLQAHGHFLIAIITMSLGWVFLDVAANPLAASIGTDDKFVWRLNVAQAVYPIGTIVAIVFEKWLPGIQVAAFGARFMFSAADPYILLGAGVLVIAYLFEAKRFPQVAIERSSGGEGKALRSLLSDRTILFAMAAQGVGIMILIANGAIGGRYLAAAFHADSIGPLGNVFFWAALVFAAGRIAGCFLMRFIAPRQLLIIFAVAGVACSLAAAMGWTTISGFAILANQFFASILWPTILGLTICGRGPLMKLATALVCMGSAAGGIVFQLLFMAWPSLPTQAGMVLMALCFAAEFGFAHACSHREVNPPSGCAS
jgi:FHS family L-fucose permease-like MFS transporter